MMDLSVLSAILKEDYLGPLRSVLNVATPVLSRLVKNTKDIKGSEAVIPIRFRNQQGIGARAEKGVLPAAVDSVYKEARPVLKYYYGAVELTGQAVRQTEKGDKSAFLRAIDSEVKSLKESLPVAMAHDFYLGHRLATCGVTGASTTVVLNDDSNMFYFEDGMRIDIVDAATGLTVVASGRVVNSMDAVNKTITISGAAVATAATDIVVRESTYGNCVTGLDSIIDSAGSLYGIDPASYPKWASFEQNAGTFSLAEMKKFIDNIVKQSGKYPSVLISNFEVQGMYLDLVQANPRFLTGEPKMLDGGFKSLQYSAGGSPITWLADRLAPAKTLYALYEPDLQVFSPADFDFLADDKGAVWHRNLGGASATDTMKAILFRDIELGCYARNSHGKWTGIA